MANAIRNHSSAVVPPRDAGATRARGSARGEARTAAAVAPAPSTFGGAAGFAGATAEIVPDGSAITAGPGLATEAAAGHRSSTEGTGIAGNCACSATEGSARCGGIIGRRWLTSSAFSGGAVGDTGGSCARATCDGSVDDTPEALDGDATGGHPADATALTAFANEPSAGIPSGRGDRVDAVSCSELAKVGALAETNGGSFGGEGA